MGSRYLHSDYEERDRPHLEATPLAAVILYWR